ATRTITPLAPFHRYRVEVEDHAQIRWPARDRQTRTLIAELLLIATGMKTLQPIDLTPRHTPRAEVLFQFTHRLLKRGKPKSRALVIRPLRINSFPPAREQSHGWRFNSAHLIPGFEFSHRCFQSFGARGVR